MAPAARRGPTGRRRPAPYNVYVQRDRLEKFYERKRTLSKFRRLQRFEERQQGHQPAEEEDAGSSLLARALIEGPETFDKEYERRLALSFGDGGTTAEADTAAAAVRRKGRVRRRQQLPAADDAAVLHGQPVLSQAPDANKTGSGAKRARTQTGEAEGVSARRHQKAKAAEEAKVAKRFAKEMRLYREAQAAKEAERQRRLEEAKERNRRRKDFAKQRAVKGQLLGQRTKWGQPRMRERLDSLLGMVSAKVAQDRPASGVAAARR